MMTAKEESLTKILIVVIILLIILVALLTCMIIYYRNRYQSLVRKTNKDQHPEDVDNDEIENVEKVHQNTKKRSSVDFYSAEENLSELTTSNNGDDIELGQLKAYPKDDEITNRNDLDLTKSTFISKWKSKVHKTSWKARRFLKRILINNNENKDTLKHYGNSTKLSPSSNSSIGTREKIIIPFTMLPEMNNSGVIRFTNNCPNSPYEPLKYLTLNTFEIERENNSTCEEFRLKSVRIINSPR